MAQHLLERAGAGNPVEPVVPFEVETVRFGTSLAVVALSEITVEHGLRFKRELRAALAMRWHHYNGIVGYVPVRRQIPGATTGVVCPAVPQAHRLRA